MSTAEMGTSELTRLLRAAMQRKGEDLGRQYSLRDLGRDANVHWTLASKAMTGQQQATPQALAAWASALEPHLDLDAARMAAGYPPLDTGKASVWRRLVRLTAGQWGELEQWMGERVTEDEANDQRSEQK